MPRHVKAGFDGGVDTLVMAGFKQRVRQLRVHKRFAAGEGDPAAAAVVEGFIAQYGRHDLFDLLFFAANGQRLRRAAVGEGIKRLFT
ncbi:Uncharacterised protein [Klebsiella pneumoniae]|nr:Uncharacterised protein [Klebsiella pneumoniae]